MIDLVDIKNTFGNIRFSTPINEGSKRKFSLMKEDYITLKFSVPSPVHFHLGDGIDNELGIFELVDMYKPTYNENTDGYDYELRLDAYYWKWKNKKFFYTPEDGGCGASWSLTASLKTHMEAFTKNLEVLGYNFREQPFEAKIDPGVGESSKLVSYDKCNLIDALTQMAEAWECEWWMEDKYIRFGRCEFSDPVDFILGENVNSMQRSDSQSMFATRIYAFGATRNIPKSYRKKLVFDVKTVNGRDISDTARVLKADYFPSSVVHKEEFTADVSTGSGIFTSLYTEWTLDKDIASLLKDGVYKVISDGITLSASTMLPPIGIGTRAFLPAGKYILKASYIYNASGISKEISIGNKEITLSQNQQSEISVDFKFAESLEIEKGASNLKIRVYVRVPAPTSFDFNSIFSAYASYKVTLRKGSSANTSITFLTGRNVGQSYPFVYNPDFLIGETSNIIRLPEGVTASLGDMYTINNIIKGKVPDNYFSKDDNETTVNGVVQKRLMLPVDVPYVDAYENMSKEEAVEEIVIFEDEYAKYIGNTDEVPKPTLHDEKDDNDKPTGNKYPIYTFRDTGLKNFTNDFLLDELRMIFQTGKLAGMDFAINIDKSDDSGTTFKIIRNEDYGRHLPDETLFPQAKHVENGKDVPADTYILHGFDTAFLSEDMLLDAEKSLLKKAKEYVEKSKIDPSTYNCQMMSDRMKYLDNTPKLFELGDRVNLINAAYFEEGNRQSRIIGFEYNLDIPYDSPVYIVGETAAYSRLGAIESKIDSLTFKGQSYNSTSVGSGGPGVYVIGINDKTLPSDRNVLSAKKSLQSFLRRDIPDEMRSLLTLLDGLVVEKGIISDILTAGEINVLETITAKKALFTDDVMALNKITTLNLLVQSIANIYDLTVSNVATLMGTIIKEYVSSDSFVSGFAGSGMKIYKAFNGDWNMEIDNLTVRKIFSIFELVVQKVIHQGGMAIRSAAGGKLTKVTDGGSYWKCEHDSTDDFVAGDQVLCQVFTGVSLKRYWRLVTSAGSGYFNLSKVDCEAGSSVPEVGDDVAVLGNRNNTSRQKAQIDCAIGDTAPYRDDYDGINSYSLVNKLISRTGNLSGIVDEDLGALSGAGLYSSNVFLKGTFHLKSSGKTIENEIKSSVDGIQVGGRNLLLNSGMFKNINYWRYIGFGDGNSLVATSNSTLKLTVLSSTGLYAWGHLINQYMPKLILGNEYTYSVRLRVSRNRNVRFGFRDSPGSMYYMKVCDATETFTTFHNTFTYKGESLTPVIQTQTDMPITGDWIEIEWVKLEEGNKPTDWTPAPEDADAKYTTKTEFNTQVKVLSDSISLNATKEETNLLANRISSAEAKVTSEQINLVVKEQTIKIANNAVNDLQIGSRNYARGTSSEYISRTLTNGVNQCLTGFCSAVYLDEFKVGDILCVSFDYEYTDFVKGAQNYISLQSAGDVTLWTGGGLSYWLLDKINFTEKSGVIHASFVTAPLTENQLKNTFWKWFGIRHDYITGTARIRRFKVEKGNKPTDWTPAPEDADAKYTTKTEFNAQVKVLSDSISLNATKEETNLLANRISSAEAKVTSEQINLVVKEQTTQIANEAVEKIQLGGRNLAIGTQYWEGKAFNSPPVGTTVLKSDGFDGNEIWIPVNNTNANTTLILITKGEEITISFDIKFKDISKIGQVCLLQYFNNNVRTFYAWVPISDYQFTNNQYQRITYTHACDNTAFFSLGLRASWCADTVIIRKLKIERGNKATDWTPASEDVSQMGGRNLLLNAGLFNSVDKWGYAKTVTRVSDKMLDGRKSFKIDNSNFTSDIWWGIQQFYGSSETVIPGEIFTSSVYTYTDDINSFDLGTGLVTQFYDDSDKEMGYYLTSITPSSNNSWQRFSTTSVCPAGATKMRFFAWVRRNGRIWLNGMKLERGNKATDWSPAPEDFSTTEEIKSQFTMDKDGISMLGKKIALTGLITFSSLSGDAQNKITTAQLTADTAKANADNLKTSLKGMAYENLVSFAKLDKTIIDGGYIKASLIDVDTIITPELLAAKIDANAIITKELLAEKIAATDITTNRLTVGDGAKIAGFKVSGYGLTNAGFNNDAYIVMRNDLKDIFCGVGVNTLPATTAAYALARFENGYKTPFTNYGMIVSAKNGGSGNIAISIPNGVIEGFRLKTKTINAGETIENGIGFAQVNYTTFDPTIFLPNNPEIGTFIIISSWNRAIYVNGNGRSIYMGGGENGQIRVSGYTRLSIVVFNGSAWIWGGLYNG